MNTCPICKKQFKPSLHFTKYCSLECRKEGYKLIQKKTILTAKQRKELALERARAIGMY